MALGGVLMTLYGRNDGEPEPGSWMKTTTTAADGFFNFYIVPPYDFEYFTLVAESPTGMVATGAWSDDGTVVGSKHGEMVAGGTGDAQHRVLFRCPHTYANANRYTYTHSHPDSNSIAHLDTDSHPNCDAHDHPNTNTYHL